MRESQSGLEKLVLVVEDEPIIRMCAVDLVESVGFVAVEAANADEAVQLIDNGLDISIIFTDVDMPGSMDGLELIRVVLERNPGVGVIVASGRRMPSPAELPAPARFFLKPYDEQRIADTLREL
jgi:CheY-like chemotaxis protein